jgi:hypothetical protein
VVKGLLLLLILFAMLVTDCCGNITVGSRDCSKAEGIAIGNEFGTLN